jgi:hypothetical protein
LAVQALGIPGGLGGDGPAGGRLVAVVDRNRRGLVSRNRSTPTQAGLSGHSACSDCGGWNPRVRLTGAKGAVESPG